MSMSYSSKGKPCVASLTKYGVTGIFEELKLKQLKSNVLYVELKLCLEKPLYIFLRDNCLFEQLFINLLISL